MSRTRFEITQKGPVLYGLFVRDKGPSAFTEDLLAEIDDFSARIEADPEIRAGIIASSGRVFSLGTDLEQLERGFADPHVFRRYLIAFNRTMDRIERLPVPIVAAVNGMARAGGLEVVLAADVAIIADDALIGDAHSAQNAIPAGGSTQRLPRRVGAPRAKELTWSGRFMSAAEAVEWGLCYKMVPAAELMSAVEALVATFVDKPRPCLSEIKNLIGRSETMSMSDGVELEIASFLLYVQNHPYVRDTFEAFQATKAKAAASA
jgi:enoyl-CoA hydratase/carnithine racemase